jgi:hypothetical protein
MYQSGCRLLCVHFADPLRVVAKSNDKADEREDRPDSDNPSGDPNHWVGLTNAPFPVLVCHRDRRV